MLTNNNQWVLFGVDLSRLWHVFATSWQTVFMAPDSRLRAKLDEPVGVLEWVNEQWDRTVVGNTVESVKSTAYLIPERMVLIRQLKVPRSVDVELQVIVEAEVKEASPFLPEDTAFGWISRSEADNIHAVEIAIVSKSTTLAFLAEAMPNNDLAEEEVWVRSGSEYIVVLGFGEKTRGGRYKLRLKKMALYLLSSVVCLTAMLSVPVVYKYIEVKELRASLEALQQQSIGAMKARSNLADVNEAMTALNQSLKDSASIVASLEYITNTLPDDAWLTQYEQKENKIQIAGTAKNAADLMQKFVNHEYFYDVVSSSAIRKVGSTGLETFRIQFAVRSLAEGEK